MTGRQAEKIISENKFWIQIYKNTKITKLVIVEIV